MFCLLLLTPPCGIQRKEYFSRACAIRIGDQNHINFPTDVYTVVSCFGFGHALLHLILFQNECKYRKTIFRPSHKLHDT